MRSGRQFIFWFVASVYGQSVTCRTAANSFVVTSASNDFSADYAVEFDIEYLGFHEGVTSGCELHKNVNCTSARSFSLRWPHASVPESVLPPSPSHRWTLAGVRYQPASVDVFHAMAAGCPTFGIEAAPDVACVAPTCLVSTSTIRRLSLGPQVVRVVVGSASGIVQVGVLDTSKALASVRMYAGHSSTSSTPPLATASVATALYPYFVVALPDCSVVVRVGVLRRAADTDSGFGLTRVCLVATVRLDVGGVSRVEGGAMVSGAKGVMRVLPSAAIVGGPFVSDAVGGSAALQSAGLGVPSTAPNDRGAAALGRVPSVVSFGSMVGVSSRVPFVVNAAALVVRSMLPSRAIAVTGPGGVGVVDSIIPAGGLALRPALPTGAAFDDGAFRACLSVLDAELQSGVHAQAASESGGVQSAASSTRLARQVGIGDRLLCSRGVLLALCGAVVSGRVLVPAGAAVDLVPGCHDRTDVSSVAFPRGAGSKVSGSLVFSSDPSGEYAAHPPRTFSTDPPTVARTSAVVTLGKFASGPLDIASLRGVCDLGAATLGVILPTTPSAAAAQLVSVGVVGSGLGTLSSLPQWMTVSLEGATNNGALLGDFTYGVGYAVTLSSSTSSTAVISVEQVTTSATLYLRGGVVVCPLLTAGWYGAGNASGVSIVDGRLLRDNIARLQRFVAAVSLDEVDPTSIVYQGADLLSAASLVAESAPLPPNVPASVPSPASPLHSSLGTREWERTACGVLLFAALPNVVRGLGCANATAIAAAAERHLPSSFATAQVSFIDVQGKGYPSLPCRLNVDAPTQTPTRGAAPAPFGDRYNVRLYGLIGFVFPVALLVSVVIVMVTSQRSRVDRTVRLDDGSEMVEIDG